MIAIFLHGNRIIKIFGGFTIDGDMGDFAQISPSFSRLNLTFQMLNLFKGFRGEFVGKFMQIDNDVGLD